MKNTCTTIIKKGTYLNLMYTLFDHNNKTGGWTWVERPNNQKAVAIAAIIRENNKFNDKISKSNIGENIKLIVIKEFRVPLNDYEWGLPAGLIDDNELIEETAKRELLEETGCEITKILRSTPFIYNSPGITNESIAIVYAEAKRESLQRLEGSEDIEVYLMNKREVRRLMERGKLNEIKIGAKAWMIFEMFTKQNNLD